MEQQGRADADDIAVDGGDQRHVIVGEGTQQPPHRYILPAARGGHVSEEVGEVVAAGKVLALPFERDEADVAVGRGALDRVGQGCVHGNGDGVAPLGSSEGDGQMGAAPFYDDMFAHCRLAPVIWVTFMAPFAIAEQISAKP